MSEHHGSNTDKAEHFETRAVRNRMTPGSQREHSSALYMTSSFLFEDAEQARSLFAGESEGNIYSRYSNPNTDELIGKLSDLEGLPDGLALASGMAAMFAAFMGILESGDHIVASRSIFGSTHQILTQLLPRWNISHSYVDIGAESYRDDPESAWLQAIRPNTKMIFCETPSNPGLDIIDLEMLGRVARQADLLFAVDNCFATPYVQTPGSFGANLVAHSTTKFIDGQGRTIGGALLGDEQTIDRIRFFARHSGPSMSPFNAWILAKSLETLGPRMDRHCANAAALADVLADHPKVGSVKYPFRDEHPGREIAKKQMKNGGALVSFELNGGLPAGRAFLDRLKMISLSANLGDSRSIATHPASTTHSKLAQEERLQVGISDGFVRISAGLEHIDDICADVIQALDGIA